MRDRNFQCPALALTQRHVWRSVLPEFGRIFGRQTVPRDPSQSQFKDTDK